MIAFHGDDDPGRVLSVEERAALWDTLTARASHVVVPCPAGRVVVERRASREHIGPVLAKVLASVARI